MSDLPHIAGIRLEGLEWIVTLQQGNVTWERSSYLLFLALAAAFWDYVRKGPV